TIQPGGGEGGPATGVLWAQGGQGGGGGAPWAVFGGGPAHWEYKFVDLKGDDRTAFEKEITSAGHDGWEFVGAGRLRRGNEAAQLTLVFKRPKGGAAMGGFGGGGFGPGGGFGGGGFGGGRGGALGGMFGPGGIEGIESKVHKLKNATAVEVAAA